MTLESGSWSWTIKAQKLSFHNTEKSSARIFPRTAFLTFLLADSTAISTFLD